MTTDPTPLDPAGRELNFRFIGDATLNHEFGRSWTAAATYLRSVDYHEGFADPFLSDGVAGSVTGLLSRVLRFDGTVNYSFGIVGFNSNNGFYAVSPTQGAQRPDAPVGPLRPLSLLRVRVDQPAALDSRLQAPSAGMVRASVSPPRFRSFDRSLTVIPGKNTSRKTSSRSRGAVAGSSWRPSFSSWPLP